MKPIKKVSKNGVNIRPEKVVFKLFFANYFLAKKHGLFAKIIKNFISTFLQILNYSNVVHYETRHEPCGYVRKIMIPIGASSAYSSIV